MLLPFERELVLRGDFEAVLPRDDFAAPPVVLFADERVPLDLRAADERLEPVPADFARVVDDFFAPPLARDAVERFAVELCAPPLLDRFAAERDALDLRAPLERADALPDDPELEELAPLLDILPDITRCAASATASAMIVPSLVALAVSALAACDAVSAASSPASRIFLRAAGLALIAAAAAARPAASISLLIAALASLSTVLSLEPERAFDDEEPERDFEEVEREELLRADFAIFNLPPSRERHFRAVPVP